MIKCGKPVIQQTFEFHKRLFTKLTVNETQFNFSRCNQKYYYYCFLDKPQQSLEQRIIKTILIRSN